MDIRHLEYFLEVARNQSFTKVAEKLYITRPTISKTIRNMEDEWGVTLFYRQGKRIELTDAGHIMYQQAQQMVDSFQRVSAELEDLMNLKRGHLRIGLPPMVGSSFFPEVIGQFHREYPKITIQLIEDGAKKVEADVEGGQTDIGVAVPPVNEDVFHYYSFVKEKLNLLVHPSHQLAGRDHVHLNELADEAFVLFREDFTRMTGLSANASARASSQGWSMKARSGTSSAVWWSPIWASHCRQRRSVRKSILLALRYCRWIIHRSPGDSG